MQNAKRKQIIDWAKRNGYVVTPGVDTNIKNNLMRDQALKTSIDTADTVNSFPLIARQCKTAQPSTDGVISITSNSLSSNFLIFINDLDRLP